MFSIAIYGGIVCKEGEECFVLLALFNHGVVRRVTHLGLCWTCIDKL